MNDEWIVDPGYLLIHLVFWFSLLSCVAGMAKLSNLNFSELNEREIRRRVKDDEYGGNK